ncbi:MAG: SGNH/GDSL hydrolase family protein [Trueperaceae bacterium]|nr:SGNH/GDSL hydrolase family protein [Trueperaceae bacterium]
MNDERTVLCYGDSNTWGYEPGTSARYGRTVRWPGVLAAELGAAWHVVEAGLNGRTTVFEDPMGDKNGLRHLGPILESAAPVDVAVVILGTNDLKTRFRASAYEIAEGAGRLVDVVRASSFGRGGVAPLVLLVAPPPLATLEGWAARDPDAFEKFEENLRDGLETSGAFARQYARVAHVRGVAFLDAGAHVATSPVDGVHWAAEGHAAFGRAVAAMVRDLCRAGGG